MKGGILLTVMAVMLAGGRSVSGHGAELVASADDLEVQVNSKWVGGSYGGYLPVRIRIKNGGKTRQIEVRFSGTVKDEFQVPEVTRRVSVAEGGTTQFTLLIPLVGRDTAGHLEFLENGRSIEALEVSQFLLPTAEETVGVPTVLMIGESMPETGALKLALQLKGQKSASGGTPSTTEAIELISPTSLPDSWLAYSGVDVVVISREDLQKLPTETRSPLLRWVETGGMLWVVRIGNNPEDFPAFEQLLPEGGAATKGIWKQMRDFSMRKLMLGHVIAIRKNPFPGTERYWDEVLSGGNRQALRPVPVHFVIRNGLSARQPHEEFLKFEIPSVEGAPVVSFLVLITGFVLIIGPVNYLLLKRKGRMNLLLATIPALSITSSLLLFAYSALSYGFSVRSRVRSVTILDQPSQRAVTLSRESLFAGMSPSSGLKFSAETAVLPVWQSPENPKNVKLDWSEGQHFVRGWLPSRTRVQFYTIRPQEQRGRLEVKPTGAGAYSLSNGLQWNLKKVYVIDDQKQVYYAENVAAGDEVILELGGEVKQRLLLQDLVDHQLELPDEIKKRGESGRRMFEMEMRRSPGSRGYFTRAPNIGNFADSTLEGLIAGVRKFVLSSENDPNYQGSVIDIEPHSILALVEGSPGVDVGLARTEEELGLHLLISNY